MKAVYRRIAVLAMTATGWLGMSGQTAGSGRVAVMSLDSCIAVALDSNPTIKVADMEIERMDLGRKETIGQLLPTLSFGGNYSRMIAKQVAYMNMDGFPGLGGEGGEDEGVATQAEGGKGDNGIKMGLDNSYQLGFSASLPLIAPQLWQSIKLNDGQIAQSIEQARSSKLSLVNQVKSAYYTLQLAIDSKRVIEESMEMARFTADLYEKKFALGAASEYDVLRTQVAVKNVEPELTQAEIAVNRARLQLLLLMGIADYIEINPDEKLEAYEARMYEMALTRENSIEWNPDLRLLDIQTKLLEQNVKVQKMAWYPTLALSANYNWTSSSNGSPLKNFRWNPYSMIGLSLQIPIFEGGQRYHRIRQAEIQAAEMTWQRENLVNSINTQVTLARDNITLNMKQIASCGESVKQAEKAHSIARQSFEIGAGTYLDLRDAELALTRARLAYSQAIYNYLVADSELELLTGTFDLKAYTPAQ